MTTAVMIVGATGSFGGRLLDQLIGLGFRHFILAGRDEGKAQVVIDCLRAKAITALFVRFDRTAPDLAVLKNLAPFVVVDAAGPFQHCALALAEAAIAAKAHYIDLADARDFVARIPTLDAAAKRAGVAVITGASSTPALSHAVLDQFAKDWRRIDKIKVAIAPGNRAARGLSVVKAILSYVGAPVLVFREGAFQPVPGWGLNERIEIQGVGKRQVAICDTPDLDLLVSRYQPGLSAEFKAGLELGVMHHTLRAFSWLRQRKLLPGLVPLGPFLLRLANWLEPFGTDRGGMLVEVQGLDEQGAPNSLRWSLAAGSGLGPNVPALPAAILIRKLEEQSHGAYAAAGLLRYADILPFFAQIGITTKVSRMALPHAQVFERALGAGWALLPPTTRHIHAAIPATVWRGHADVRGAQSLVGRAVAKLFSFPVTAEKVPVRVAIESDGQRELWARSYPTRTMRSVMKNPDPLRQTVDEHFGPYRFRLRLVASSQGIDMHAERVFLGPLPLPKWCLPKIVATERVNACGEHVFDVQISLWPLGLLVHYQGNLAPIACPLP